MKIALVIELFYPHMAGCERRFFEIGRGLSRRGHEVHVFTLQHDAGLPREETIEGMFVHRFPHVGSYISPVGFRTLNGIFKFSLATAARLSGESFDVYYSNQWPIIHSIFARPVASPLVQEWCEVWTESLKVIMLQKLLKRAGNYHVAVSEFTRDRLINFLKIRPEKISVVPNGVEYSKFCSTNNKKRWGRIVYVGRLVPHKHVDVLIDAYRQVKEKAPEAELHIVGSGPSFSQVKEEASNTKDCFVYGFLPDDEMLDLLKHAWLFAMPSEREGSGIAVLEAMAAGLPFVTLNYPNNAAKELTRFRCGLGVSPSSHFLASAILQCYNDDKMWKQMSNEARHFAKTHDWSLVIGLMESFLEKVAVGV